MSFQKVLQTRVCLLCAKHVLILPSVCVSNCLNFALPRDVFCFGLNFVSLPSRKFCFLFSFAKNVCILKNKAYRLEIFLRLFFKSFYHTTKSDPTGKLPFEKTGIRTFFAPLKLTNLDLGDQGACAALVTICQAPELNSLHGTKKVSNRVGKRKTKSRGNGVGDQTEPNQA